MSQLTVVAVLVAVPGQEGLVREALSALVPPSREEPGCVSYELSESQGAPGTFVTVEVWEDQAAIDAHFQTPHVQEALAGAGEALASTAIHPLTRLV